MNVLVLAPFPPLPECSGSRMRAMTLLRSLAGHQVFLVAFCGADEPIAAAEMQKYLAEIHIFPRPHIGFLKVIVNHFSMKPLLAKRFFLPAAQKKIRQLAAERKIDLVISETLLMNEYLREVPWARRILDEHNLEFIRAQRRMATTCNGFKKLYYYLIMRRLRRYELKAANAAEICLTCSTEDAEWIDRLGTAKRVVVLPNTIDSGYFRPQAAKRDPLRIVFTGTMWYEPNVDAMRYFCREILPLVREKISGATLIIAGDKPAKEVLGLGRDPGVTVTGYVDDIRPLLAEATVFVAPLRMGSGTRLKILGAMAMGVPVVSTSIGVEGIAAQDGLNIRIADKPGDFAAAVLSILSEPVLHDGLAAAGRKLVLENYTHQAVERQLRRLWGEMGREHEGKCLK